MTKTVQFPIVLKSIIDIAVREKTIVDDNAKKIRAKLRATLNDSHVKNTSWVANNMTELNRIRCAFDPVYAERLANARKRNAKKNVTQSPEKVDAE